MPGSSNTSFIPKRNPTQKSRQDVKKKVFLGSFIVRILFFAALIAAAIVFVYEMKLKKDLNTEIRGLNEAVASFNEADMERVVKMDLRLKQAYERRQYSASIVTVLGAIEKSITVNNKINELKLDRVDDSTIEIEAEMETGTYDSVLFQRTVLEKGNILHIDGIDELTLHNVPPDNLFFTGTDSKIKDTKTKPGVKFIAKLAVDVADVPHKVVPVGGVEILFEEPIVNQESVADNNQEGL